MKRLLPLLLAASCATASSSRTAEQTASGFPTKESLKAITATPVPGADRSKYVDVDTWDLSGPFDEGDPLASRPAQQPWDALVDDAARARPNAQVNWSMHCAARELGRFHLQNGAHPAPSLQAFVLARCGTMVPYPRVDALTGEVPDGVTDERIFSEWQQQIAAMIAELPQEPNQSIGLWFGREGNKAIFFLASGQRLAELHAFHPGAAPAEFILEGRLLNGDQNVRALINRGRFGVADCELGAQAAPSFALRCEASAEDDYAWIEIASFPPGRILGKTVLNAVVFPKGAAVDRWTRTAIGDLGPVQSGADVSSGLLAAINQIRQTANLAPLALDPGQSATASLVAGHYFAALFGKLPPQTADTIVLGLRAGWDVEGVVKYGKVTSAAGVGATTIGFMVSTAIERPFGREVLLDPEVRRLAIGPLVESEEKFYGAVLATYSLFESESQDPAVLALDLLSQRRSEAGREPAKLFTLGDLPQQAAQVVNRGEKTPAEALDWFLKQSVKQTNRGLSGWVFETSELDRLEFPPELVLAAGLELGISVTYFEPKDEPWGRYVVLIVMSQPTTDI